MPGAYEVQVAGRSTSLTSGRPRSLCHVRGGKAFPRRWPVSRSHRLTVAESVVRPCGALAEPATMRFVCWWNLEAVSQEGSVHPRSTLYRSPLVLPPQVAPLRSAGASDTASRAFARALQPLTSREVYTGMRFAAWCIVRGICSPLTAEVCRVAPQPAGAEGLSPADGCR